MIAFFVLSHLDIECNNGSMQNNGNTIDSEGSTATCRHTAHEEVNHIKCQVLDHL